MSSFIKSQSHLGNSSGFSLISVMIAIGLVSFLSLAVMNISESSSKHLKYTNSVEDVANIAQQVTGLLSIPVNCKNLFSGEAVDVTNIGSSATPQLNVSAKSPYAGMGAMSTIESGKIKLNSLGVSFIRSLGAGQPWYQANAMVIAYDPATAVRFAPRKVPINVKVNGAGAISDCNLTSASNGVGGAGGGALPAGAGMMSCPTGQVMTGFTAAGGIACAGGGQVASGTGCTGDNCTANDGGPCYGDNCHTNGDHCEGDNCRACATFPGSGPGSSLGVNSCAGTACPGC